MVRCLSPWFFLEATPASVKLSESPPEQRVYLKEITIHLAIAQALRCWIEISFPLATTQSVKISSRAQAEGDSSISADMGLFGSMNHQQEAPAR